MTTPVVLLLEDNPGDVALLREALVERGVNADLVVAENAVMAYRYLDRRPPFRDVPDPALVIIDLNLPVIPGEAVLHEIKQGRWADVPAVILSSSDRPTEISRCISAGAADYLVKPAVFEQYLDLVPRLARFLDEGPPPRPTRPSGPTRRTATSTRPG
jgi:two-component system response regulator